MSRIGKLVTEHLLLSHCELGLSWPSFYNWQSWGLEKQPSCGQRALKRQAGLEPGCRALYSPCFVLFHFFCCCYYQWIKWSLMFELFGWHLREFKKHSTISINWWSLRAGIPWPISYLIQAQEDTDTHRHEGGRRRKKDTERRTQVGVVFKSSLISFSEANATLSQPAWLIKEKESTGITVGYSSHPSFWPKVNKLLCLIPAYLSPKP